MTATGNPNASRMSGVAPKRVNSMTVPASAPARFQKKRVAKKAVAKRPTKKVATKKTGTFRGKSNKLGHGGRASQLRAQGVPAGVIGAIARKKAAAPGQKNYHGKRR